MSRPRNKEPPRLATGAAMVARCIDGEINASPTYHRHASATRRREDALIQIERRSRRRDLKNRRGAGVLANRVRDLKAFLAYTYGEELPDDDGGRDGFFILAHHVARLNGTPERNIRRYAATWVSWMGDDELAALVRRVLAKPYRWGADKLGQKIGLMDSVRTALRITTIRPIDVSADELKRRQRERKNAKRRKQTREQYLAGSLSKAEPWKAQGISRRTWERRRAKGVASPDVRNSLRRRGRTFVTATPRQAASPQHARS